MQNQCNAKNRHIVGECFSKTSGMESYISSNKIYELTTAFLWVLVVYISLAASCSLKRRYEEKMPRENISSRMGRMAVKT